MLLSLFILTQLFISFYNCMSTNGITKNINHITTVINKPSTLTTKPTTVKVTTENQLIQQLRAINNRDFVIAYNDFQSKVAQSSKLNTDMTALLSKMDTLLTTERDSIFKIESMMIKYPVVTTDIVKFNVGGTTFATYLTTITKKILKNNGSGYYEPNLLEGLVSGLIEVKYDDNKAIFIDRNPQYFHYILDYLRMAGTNETFKYPANAFDLYGLLNEADFYNLVGLKERFVGFSDSGILKANQSADLIKLGSFSASDYWKLVYRASVDGFGSRDFHNKVDGIPKTLTIIKTTNNFTFGGYTDASWDINGCKLDKNAFMFSLVNSYNTPVKMMYDNSAANDCSINGNANQGPVFGNDLFIATNANSNTNSYSNLGYNYKNSVVTTTPAYYYNYNNDLFLAGARNFQVTEIEIYAKL